VFKSLASASQCSQAFRTGDIVCMNMLENIENEFHRSKALMHVVDDKDEKRTRHVVVGNL
jgi:hypothetical protein